MRKWKWWTGDLPSPYHMRRACANVSQEWFVTSWCNNCSGLTGLSAMLANNFSTSTCFAIFELIKFMCFGSTFTFTHKPFPILHPPSMHSSTGSRACPANAGSRNPRGLTRSAQDSILQSGWFKLCRRNQIGIMTELMWTSQRSVRVSVLLM